MAATRCACVTTRPRVTTGVRTGNNNISCLILVECLDVSIYALLNRLPFTCPPDVPSTPTSPANVRWWQVQSTRRVAKYHNACLPQDPTGTRRRNPELFHGLPLRSTRTLQGSSQALLPPLRLPQGRQHLYLEVRRVVNAYDRISYFEIITIASRGSQP